MATLVSALHRGRDEFRVRVAAALAERRTRDLTVLLAYFLLTALWFHRLMFNFNDSVLYGPNDESYGIRQYWGSEYQHSTPFTQTRDPLNGAPEGLPMAPAIQIANAVIPTTIWVLHYAVGFTGASNIFLLGGLVLTGLSVYVLLDRMGIHPFGAFYAGYATTFNPWMLERAGAGHSGFMQAWIFPLMIAAILYAHQRRTVVSAAVMGLTLAFSFYVNSYYGLMAGVMFGVFWVVDIAHQRNWRERLWTFTLADIAFFSAVVAFTPALIAWLHNKRAVGAGISNAVGEVQSLGATTQAYFMPSFRHPLLSHITRHFYPKSEFIWSENTLYLGWTLIILGLVGAFLVLRRDPVSLTRPLSRYFLVSILVLAPTAFLFSLQRQTTWFGITIPMPSYAISEFTTFWRVFARFGLLVTFALATLAALTLTKLIRNFRYGWPVAIAAFCLLTFEYYDGVLPIYKLKPLPYSNWIAQQPPGTVANYPMPTDNPFALRLLAETYYQQIYNKHPQFMLFGSGYGGTREDAIRIVTRYVTDPLTPTVLKAEGVKYVLLHDDVYRQAGATPPPVPSGFHLVARIPGNVRALTIDPSVKPADTDSVLEQNAASIAAVQGLPAPKVELESSTFSTTSAVTLDSSEPRLRRVQLIVHAHASTPVDLSLSDQSGNQYGRWHIATGDTQVSFGPLRLANGSGSYVLRAEGGGRVTLSSVFGLPLADFSVSTTDY